MPDFEPMERGVPQDLSQEPNDEFSNEPPLIDEVPEDKEEEVERHSQDVQMIAAQSPEETKINLPSQEPQFTMKTEDPEPVDLSGPNVENAENLKAEDVEELADESKNPLLYSTSPPVAQAEPVDNRTFVRKPIMELGPSAVWVNTEELSPLIQFGSELERIASRTLDRDGPPLGKTRIPSLDTLFPELMVYEPSMPPDAAHHRIVSRPDEVDSASIPVSRFNDTHPILLSSLQPSLRLYNSVWQNFNDAPVTHQEGKRTVGDSGKGFFFRSVAEILTRRFRSEAQLVIPTDCTPLIKFASLNYFKISPVVSHRGYIIEKTCRGAAI